MVINNLNPKDIMMVDPESGNTILHRICTKNRYKAFLFLQTIMSPMESINDMVETIHFDHNPNHSKNSPWVRSWHLVPL